MAKIRFAIGLDVDLYQTIEKMRGNSPRASYINEKLRALVMPAARPSTEELQAASSQPSKEVVPACP